MATQPTQNAVPSESPRDLKFNAGKIDEFVTSLALRYTDRFGSQHYTIEGLRQVWFGRWFSQCLRLEFERPALLREGLQYLLALEKLWGKESDFDKDFTLE